MKLRALVCALWITALPAQDLSRLPGWAQADAAAALKEVPPQDANAWVLLMRHEEAYTGNGEIRKRNLRLVKVLRERGIEEGTFWLHSLGGRASKIKTLKGWNLRPDGEVVRLSKEDVAVFDSDQPGSVSTNYETGAGIPRVAVGSLVAFESEEICRMPLGPVECEYVAESEPVRRWELAFGKKEGWFTNLKEVEARIDPRHWEAWGVHPEQLPGGGLAASNVAPIPKDEHSHPDFANLLPSVELRFLDPHLPTAPSCASWDSYASWMYDHFRPAFVPSGVIPVAGLAPKEALRAIYQWMSKELIYKQVYLTPERGWLPETCPEVVRKRHGDCKDHAACFLGEASGLGFETYPVLCAIQANEVESDQPVFPYCFNHAIAALRLKESLGLPAEVETPQGRFLIVDATDRFCPFGYLPSDHRARRVLICTPKGAVWATIPPAATLEPALAIEMDGQVGADGTLTAQIRLAETGNARSLRILALEHSTDRFKEWIAQHGFKLKSTGNLTDLKTGDPLDLEHPFEVRFTLTQPGGDLHQGKNLVLPSWGLPGTPVPLQKPGVIRKLPVELRRTGTLSLRAKWTFPCPVQPVVPKIKTDNPFRTLSWQASAEGSIVHIQMDERLKDIRFEGDRKAEGVAAWKEDRNFLLNLHDMGLGFRKE